MRKPTPGSAMSAALLAVVAMGGMLAVTPAQAAPASSAPRARGPRLSIASPVTGNLVAGLVPVAVTFDAGAAGRVTLIELWVDDLLYGSEPLDLASPRGTVAIDWDTQRLRNGQHSLRVRAFSGRKLLAADAALVTVSNGGVDVVPPLVSFYTPLDGQTISGNLDIGINAADNDQVALVGLFVNRQLRLMKSDPPFKYTLDTTTLPLLNGRGTLVLEAWAYDRAQNRGVAKPITVYVNNPINATPLEPDPKGRPGARGKGETGRGGEGRTREPDARAVASSSARPVAPPPPRLSPLAALLGPTAGPAPLPAGQPKLSTPVTPPAPQAALSPPAAAHPGGASLETKPPDSLEVALAPQPSAGVRTIAPPASRPSQTTAVVKPHAAAARLDVFLGAAPAAPAADAGPRVALPPRAPQAQPVPRRLKPAPVLLEASRLARVPDGELLAVPRAQPQRPERIAGKPIPSVPEPALPRSRPAPAKGDFGPAATRHRWEPRQGSTPDLIALPVYRLARLPENLSTRRDYTVRRGDTLSRIAQQHGVTPRSILVASGLLGASEVTPGRRLSIPGTFAIAYNDQPIGFDVQPRVEKGMAIAPFRQLFEHTGGVVRYQPASREVLATNPEKQVRLKIGSREALVNSAVVVMDRAAFLDTGRTMVPVKFMTQALDLKAAYDLRTGAIYLIHK